MTASIPSGLGRRCLVDGRVFSTDAWDRGMGRYVTHIIDLLRSGRFEVTLLLYRDCHLGPDDELFAGTSVRFANYEPESYSTVLAAEVAGQRFTGFLTALIDREGYDVYVDATPFIGPKRLDIMACPVVVLCYDFIPLRHPSFYLGSDVGRSVYYNGLARVLKADCVVCISETTRREAQTYLAIESERLSVIAPTLSEEYLPGRQNREARDAQDTYLFGIAGSHKSKNPVAALGIYRGLVEDRVCNVRVNAPKPDQFGLLGQIGSLDGIELSHSISDERKIELQSGAAVIAHLSLEEGFGIPLLEGVFLDRKILALDVPITREILGHAEGLDEGNVLWLQPGEEHVDAGRMRAFLQAPQQHAFYDRIRDFYLGHWQGSAAVLDAALENASRYRRRWIENLWFKIFSSVPGSFCGVADYSVGYARSTGQNVAFFYSSGSQEQISYLPNVRALCVAEFAAFAKTHPDVPGFYNFAFSGDLYPGIKLVLEHARPHDVMAIHERAYLPGLFFSMAGEGSLDSLTLKGPTASAGDADEYARGLVSSSFFNARRSDPERGRSVSGHLFGPLPLRLVSHLSPTVLQRTRDAQTADSPLRNDLAILEDRIEYVPMGIDPRNMPGVARAAQRLRTRRGIQQDAIVVGHFGLIVDDVKRLWDVSSAIATYIADKRRSSKNRPVYLLMVGRILDHALADRISDRFREHGIAGRLLYTNPVDELDFDVEMMSCDAVVLFRRQLRGNMSHAFVRALSLGRPVIVNEASGYRYDDRTLVDDDDVEGGIARVLDEVSDPAAARELRRAARSHYESCHLGADSLQQILHGPGHAPRL